MLEVRDLTVRYGALTVLDGLSFSVREGEWLMVCGPNGAGKSTAVSAVAQGVASTGEVRFDGQDVRTMKPRARARALGLLAQNHFLTYGFSVGEVVRLGRYAYGGGMLAGAGADDEAAVARALEQTGLSALAGQSVLTLSGGELQRTFLAQLFAQDPRLLLLDEPTNHLDLVYQNQVFSLVRAWLRTPGRAVVSVVHDLSLARAYGTSALLLDRGRAVACGPVREVLTRARLQAVYGLDVHAYMRGMLAQWEEE